MEEDFETRILFRADGNATIGLGHVVRLLALADMVRGLATGTGIFLVREPSLAVIQLLATEGWQVEPLPASQPLEVEADWLACHYLRATDVVVLDGYDFREDYQHRLRKSGCALIAIDDLRAWPVVADVLINHSPGITAADYQAAPTTQFLLGPAFSLLRRPFLNAAAQPLPTDKLTSALVCFGGADPLRLTERTLKSLLTIPQMQRVGLVVGGAFGDTSALQHVADQHPAQEITIHRAIAAPSLVELLRSHAVAIVPASTILIEALVLGQPAITGYYVDNQRALADYVGRHQQAFSLGNFASLTDEALSEALTQGLHFLAHSQRQPYAARLQPEVLRAAVQRLMQRQ